MTSQGISSFQSFRQGTRKQCDTGGPGHITYQPNSMDHLGGSGRTRCRFSAKTTQNGTIKQVRIGNKYYIVLHISNFLETNILVENSVHLEHISLHSWDRETPSWTIWTFTNPCSAPLGWTAFIKFYMLRPSFVGTACGGVRVWMPQVEPKKIVLYWPRIYVGNANFIRGCHSFAS